MLRAWGGAVLEPPLPACVAAGAGRQLRLVLVGFRGSRRDWLRAGRLLGACTGLPCHRDAREPCPWLRRILLLHRSLWDRRCVGWTGRTPRGVRRWRGNGR